MEKKLLSPEQLDLLNKHLPPEALKQHPTKKFLTTINAAFVIERMNDVFGVGMWRQEMEVVVSDSKMVVLKSTLIIDDYGIKLETFGGNDNPDLGDAYKGAQTDALTKACSFLGIGAHVWKNEKVGEVAERRYATPATPIIANTNTTTGEVKNCPKCSAPMRFIPAGTNKMGTKYNAFYVCDADQTKVSTK